jgi:lipid A 3-O-deacylase
VPRAPRKIARFGESAQGPPILGPDELGRSMRRVRQGLRIALAAATLASEPTWAGGLVEEIKGGVLYHDVGGLWSGFRLEDEPIDINVEAVLSPSMPALWGVVRPAVGASINTGGDTSHVYLDARWQTEFASGLFFGLGLGAAVHDGKLDPTEPDRKALGSRVLFHIPAEIGLRLDAHNSVSVYFEHTSNADLAEFNEGMDRVGLRYGYRF